MIKLDKNPNKNSINSDENKSKTVKPKSKQRQVMDKLSDNPDEISVAKQAETRVWNNIDPNETAKLVFNEFEEENFKKRNRKKKVKSYIIVGLFFTWIFIIPIICFISVKQVKVPNASEIAQIANIYNGNTNFPTAGVQAYLDKNINDMMQSQFKNHKNGKVIITNPEITSLNKLSDKLSSIYFTIQVHSNKKVSQFNCFMQLAVDDKGYYRPATEPIIIPRPTNSDKTTILDKSSMKFEDSKVISQDIAEKESKFVDNFFKLFYSGQDVGTMYNGAKLKRDPQITYVNMNNFQVYSKPNKTGFNAVCDVVLNTHGVDIITKKYILIKPSGNTYIISALL